MEVISLMLKRLNAYMFKHKSNNRQNLNLVDDDHTKPEEAFRLEDLKEITELEIWNGRKYNNISIYSYCHYLNRKSFDIL